MLVMEGLCMYGGSGTWEVSVPSSQFCSEPKTTLKKISEKCAGSLGSHSESRESKVGRQLHMKGSKSGTCVELWKLPNCWWCDRLKKK